MESADQDRTHRLDARSREIFAQVPPLVNAIQSPQWSWAGSE